MKARIEHEADTRSVALAAWYLNLSARPHAQVEVLDRTLRVRAEEAAAFWPRVLEAAPDYAKYPQRTSRRIPLVRLIPVS